MKYAHRSAQRVILDKSRTYKQEYFKPKGIWFEVDGDWERWCSSEEFWIERLAVSTELELDESRILTITHEGEIDRFTEKWIYPSEHRYDRWINWPRVAETYAGIVIAPYLWSRRMTEHTFWYYGWDCASGCVWDLSAIKKWEMVVSDTVRSVRG